MITEWFISVGQSIATWALGLFGTADPPAFLLTMRGWIAGLLTSASGLGVWIPWVFVLSTASIVLGLWLIGLLVKAVRWLIGLIPTMGGGS